MSIEKVPAVFTGQAWDKKVSVELDHSDITMSELLDVFKGLALSLGFSEEIWKEEILDMAGEYTEEMNESETLFQKDSINTELQSFEEILRSIISGEIYTINDESVEAERKSKKKKSK